jgi:hypothetical protein
MGIEGLCSMRLRLGHILLDSWVLCLDLHVARIPYITVSPYDDTFLDDQELK